MRTNRSSAENVLPMLESVYFYLTALCNLSCRHCWIDPGIFRQGTEHLVLDPRLLKSVIEQAGPLGLKGVKLTGGEPLIHPKIISILEYLRTRELSVQIETNGTACTRDIARSIAGLSPCFVSVSLDGVDADTHEWMRGRTGCFAETLQGIGNLLEQGIRPQIVMSVVERNKGQMTPMVKMAESLGAHSVKFNLVQPMGRGEALHTDRETIPIHELVAIGRWVETDLASSTHLTLFYDHPLAFRPMSRMFGACGDGCSQCKILNIIGVMSDGCYAMCGIGESIPDLAFGHVEKDALEDVWNNNPVLRDLRSGLPHRIKGICGKCVMRFFCLGACVAQNYFRSGSLWGSHWFCEQAFEHGLFPKSRLTSEPRPVGLNGGDCRLDSARGHVLE